MANDDSANGYHGYRFLVDATNSRQYAVPYTNGQAKKPISVFAMDERDDGFRPNEAVFAFDDQPQMKANTQGGAQSIHVATILMQIMTDGAAEPRNLKQIGVEFKLSFTPDGNGDLKLTYKMTAESLATIEAASRDSVDAGGEGWNMSFPREFSETISGKDPAITRSPSGAITAVDPRLLEYLSFPPHHDGGALVARQNMETPTDGSVLAPRPEDQIASTPVPAPKPVSNLPVPRQPTQQASGDFNRSTGTTTAPARTERHKVPNSAIEAIIKQFCDDLTDKASRGDLDPVVGRDVETDQAIKVLSRRKQASLCFTGDAGVGKTAMFSGIAQRINDDINVPESLRGARVLQLDLQAMNAGAKFRGQFEEKLKPLIDGLKERGGYLNGRKVILAIDEIHSQLTSGKAEGGTDAGNMMKPFFTAKGISVMGTTTGEEYRKHIEKDPALASRFEQMVLGQPDEKSTGVILRRLWPLIKEHHKLAEDLSEDDFDYIVQMSNRYAPNEAQPRKGEKVLDMAGASARFRGSNVIEREDVIAAVAQMSKLSPEFLSQNDGVRFLRMEKELPEKVLGQPGIQKVVDGLIGARSGLNDPNQPWGCFVLQGPTGTGKTELCKALAEYLFGSAEAMIKLDMAEYSDKHTVSRLIGAPPGFVGFDSAEPALTERVRQQPYSILLLDEIEKAHADVFNVLLPVLNDGKMTDNQGKETLFNNVIVIMTTNLGAKEATELLQGKAGIAFGGATDDKDPKTVEKSLDGIYKKARNGFFRPEMINRIEELGGFVTWLPLTQAVIRKLVDRQIDVTSKRLSGTDGARLKGVTLEVADTVRDQLAKDGYDPAMGARPLRKVVREKLANPVGKWLMLNREEIEAFAAKNNGAKIVINSVDTFEPKLEAPTATISNDNKTAAPATKASTKKRAP